MLRFCSSQRLVPTATFVLFTMLPPANAGAWPGAAATAPPVACAAMPFTHTLPPPCATSPTGGKADDWISGNGIMVGLRMDYLGDWIEGSNAVFLWSKSGGRIEASARRTDIPTPGGPISLERSA